VHKTNGIYIKEIKYYFQSVTAYVTITIFLFLSGYFFHSIFKYYNFLSYQSAKNQYYPDTLNLIEGVTRPLLNNISIVLLLVLPLLTMRLISEEKRQGTFELLLTYPVSDVSVVLGKFCAALTIFSIMLAGTVVNPIMLAVFSNPEPGPILSGYLGLFLIGCTFTAMGIFFSSLTSSQLVAGVATFGVSLFFLIIGWAAPFVGATFSKVLSQFSLLLHFDSFSKGIIDSRDITYYLFLSVFFLFLTVKSLESTRWRG
jgi:ABC-2 type transport system permease protein